MKIVPVILLAASCLFFGCTKDNPVGPADLSGSKDSIRAFLLDSIRESSELDLSPYGDIYSQGNLLSTGRLFDMAIEGRGTFILKSDTATYYLRRPGHFLIDKDGYLVGDFNGPLLLGWSAGIGDTLSSELSEIRLARNELICAPKASTKIKIEGNLNADSESWVIAYHVGASNSDSNTVSASISNTITPLLEDNSAPQIFTAPDDDPIRDGALVIRNQFDSVFSINNFSALVQNNVTTTEPPADFNTIMVVTQLQQADTTQVGYTRGRLEEISIEDFNVIRGSYSNSYIESDPLPMHFRTRSACTTSIEIYDASGATHTFKLAFMHTGQLNPAVWQWAALTTHGEEILQGQGGRITFNPDGSPSSWTFDNPEDTAVVIEPNNGAPIIYLSLDWGSPGNFSGITQFDFVTTLAAASQDGYPTGTAQEFSVDEAGNIQCAFSNGISKLLWQIAICDFPCPEGLEPVGNNFWMETGNSGSPILIRLSYSEIRIKPGAIEQDPYRYSAADR